MELIKAESSVLVFVMSANEEHNIIHACKNSDVSKAVLEVLRRDRATAIYVENSECIISIEVMLGSCVILCNFYLFIQHELFIEHFKDAVLSFFFHG